MNWHSKCSSPGRLSEATRKDMAVDKFPQASEEVCLSMGRSGGRVSLPGERKAARDSFGLTRRQSQVFGKLVAGYTNKEIAGDLTISEDTAQRHIAKILKELGISNRLEVVLFAACHKLVDHRGLESKPTGRRARPRAARSDRENGPVIIPGL